MNDAVSGIMLNFAGSTLQIPFFWAFVNRKYNMKTIVSFLLFRSYTGAFVFFYVDKASGTTKMVEKVPDLGIEKEAGTMNLFEYIEKKQ